MRKIKRKKMKGRKMLKKGKGKIKTTKKQIGKKIYIEFNVKNSFDTKKRHSGSVKSKLKKNIGKPNAPTKVYKNGKKGTKKLHNIKKTQRKKKNKKSKMTKTSEPGKKQANEISTEKKKNSKTRRRRIKEGANSRKEKKKEEGSRFKESRRKAR